MNNVKCNAMPPNWEECSKGAIHDTEIVELKRRMKEIEDAIIELRDKLIGRPSWVVATLLTFSFGTTASLIVYIVSH